MPANMEKGAAFATPHHLVVPDAVQREAMHR